MNHNQNHATVHRALLHHSPQTTHELTESADMDQCDVVRAIRQLRSVKLVRSVQRGVYSAYLDGSRCNKTNQRETK